MGPTITNGNFVLRLALCSGSIGGCRKVRDWKITPGSTCLDDNPDITARAETFQLGPANAAEKTQPGPISVTISDGTASASASGTKGDVSLSASSQVGAPDSVIAEISYYDSFLITSEGKTGSGKATIAWELTTNTSTIAHISGVIYGGNQLFGRYTLHDNYPYPVNYVKEENPVDVTFTYGIPFQFKVEVGVFAAVATNLATPASASARGGYSVTVPGDPNAKITWCRTKQ